MSRLGQVLKYGWLHSGEIAKAKGIFYRLKIFFDILYCYRKYHMWSNQYLRERFNTLSKAERKIKGEQYRIEGQKRDEWQLDFQENRRFIVKYSNIRYELAHLREKRNRAYTKRYKAGCNLSVEYDVNISRQHYLDGTIVIGDNVLLGKHVFIDYSGDVIIRNNVRITNGVIIETHNHSYHTDFRKGRNIIVSTKLEIEDGAVIGSRAIIMPTCHRIGKHARVGAGAVVTHDVPDYAVVVGVPAKVIRTQEH